MNSDASIRSAERMLRAFSNSWDAIERAAEIDGDGVYIVRRSAAQRMSQHDGDDSTR